VNAEGTRIAPAPVIALRVDGKDRSQHAAA
jgi:hypothetical protein